MTHVTDSRRAQRIDMWLGRHRFGGRLDGHRRRPRGHVRHRFRWPHACHDLQPPADRPDRAALARAGEAAAGTRVRRHLPDVTEDSVRDYFRQIRRYRLLDAGQEVELALRIEAGLVAEQKLAAQPDAVPSTLRQELSRLAEDGRRARERLVTANLRLVVSVARRYRGLGLELLDLIQEGNLGLIHAVEKFDYRRGTKFSTYAMWWIRQAISRALANQARTIRIPVHVVDVMVKVGAHVSRLDRRHQGWTTASLAADLDLDEGMVTRALACARMQPVSLSRLVDMGAGDVAEFESLLAAPGDFTEQVGADVDAAVLLREVTGSLGARAAGVVVQRFGLDGEGTRTLAEVGAMYGLSRERIRQIEVQALSFLRDRHAAAEPPAPGAGTSDGTA